MDTFRPWTHLIRPWTYLILTTVWPSGHASTPDRAAQPGVPFAPFTLHPAPNTLHPTHYTLHPAPFTLLTGPNSFEVNVRMDETAGEDTAGPYFPPYTLHFVPCTLHPTPYTLLSKGVHG